MLSDPSADTGYFRDHRKVYFAGYGKWPKVACDPSTFELVAGEFARDRSYVFRRGRRIRGADPATFEILGCYYARDRHRVYAFADWHPKISVVPDADPESFLDLDTGYGTDRRNLYFHGKKSNGCKLGDDDRVFGFIRAHPELVGYWWNKTLEVDLESFEVASDGYARDRRSVYLNGRRLEEVSPGGLRSLGHGFCADREAAYWFEVSRAGDLPWWVVNGEVSGSVDRDGDRLDGADPDRLEILGSSHARERSCPGSTIRRRCFFRDLPLAGADAATFEILSPDVARDAERVWWFDKRLRKADARHFEMLSECFGRDRRRVFWHGAEITKADVASFEVLSHPSRTYARDRHSVYNANGRRVVRGLDGGTFRFLNSGYGLDASSVYETSSERRLKRVDVASFRALSPWLAKDRAGVFVHGRRERRLDPTSVEIVGEEFVRDHTRVFWYNPADMELTRLPRASPADFRVLWDGYATDGSLVFRGCEPVPASPGDLRRIGDGFVADGEWVYYSSLLQVPDRAGFELLGYGYARDEDAVYYRGSRLEGADPPTFEIFRTSPAGQFGLEIRWARDRRRVYLLSQPQPDLDPASFEILGDGYSRDAEHVLFHQAVLPKVDARSFRVLGDGYARDSSQLLFDGARIR